MSFVDKVRDKARDTDSQTTLPPSSGSALVITLGLLAVLALLVFAFTFSARTERFAARNDRDRVTARQFVDLALVQAMDKAGDFMSYNGSPAPCHWGDAIEMFEFVGANSFVSFYDNDALPFPSIFDPFYTNRVPASLWAEIDALKPHWMPIQGVDGDGKPIGTNGYIAYVVINCSGFLDAHAITSNQVARLRQDGTDIGNETAFIKDRARDTAPGSVLTNYLTLHDLARRNRGILPPVANLFVHSYDAGPDVTVTNGAVYGNREVQLLPKLDVNSWTNGFAGNPGDLSDPSDLSDHYRTAGFQDRWLHEATNRFAATGFAAPEALAWNLLNFMDPDRIPQAPEGHIAWQEPWPVEDVPLINEIAVGMVPLAMSGNKPNHYAPGIELWYPFATNRIIAADAAQLVVAVYTNWVPEVIGLAGNDWRDKVMVPAATYGFSFTNDIRGMAQGTDTEFLTFTLPPPYLAFPVTVTKAVSVAVEDDTQYMPASGSDANRLIAYADAEPAPQIYFLTQTNLFLPLGRTTYYTYLEDTTSSTSVWVNTAITVTNTIHLLARVRLGTNWVDEASGYTPGVNGRPARSDLLAFTEPCGYEVDDPRRNGYHEDWRRYLPASRAVPEWTEGAEQPVCSLNGSTNIICNPWHIPFGQGLPLVHFDQPLRRAGDIGYIQQPVSYPGLADRTRTITNLWQSICLADPGTLAANTGGFAFTAGSVLEFFAARSANTPVRGLVHFSTMHTNVVRALMADLDFGWGAARQSLQDADIDWMTEVYFEAQQWLYGGISFPIGVGDMCLGIGSVPLYREAGDPSDPSDLRLSRPWQNSLGNDLKEDLLRGLSERISFRQHVFVIGLAGRTATPSGRTSATQRAVAVVLRDAYSGRWQIVSWEWL